MRFALSSALCRVYPDASSLIRVWIEASLFSTATDRVVAKRDAELPQSLLNVYHFGTVALNGCGNHCLAFRTRSSSTRFLSSPCNSLACCLIEAGENCRSPGRVRRID